MKGYGTKIYSVENLKQVIHEQGLQAIVSYLAKAPKAVCDIIFSWCSLEEIKDFIIYQQRNKCPEIDKLIKKHIHPYENMDFDKRITTELLLLYKSNKDVCPIHKEKFVNKRIVITYEQIRSFGVLLPCCKKCRRIYISSKKFNNIEDSLIEKKIPYYLCENYLSDAETKLDDNDETGLRIQMEHICITWSYHRKGHYRLPSSVYKMIAVH